MHEGIKVPFQLPPGQANECQFTFYVQSFLMPQKLRGMVTYMVKSELPERRLTSRFTYLAPPSSAPYLVPSEWIQYCVMLLIYLESSHKLKGGSFHVLFDQILVHEA